MNTTPEQPCGVLLVDKDPGFTSHNAVALCRRILNTKKVGHCGTLDPMATGMLIVVIGKATKVQDLLMCEDKVYTATMKLGIETNSQDADGEVVAEKPTDGITEDALYYEMLDMEHAVLTGDQSVMHLDLSRDVMAIMTRLRNDWGITYPEEE